MRSTIWKKTLICLGAVLFLESPAVSTAFAYTVKAENTDAEAATSNIKSILLIGQDKREGESRQRSDSMILATLDKDQGTVSLTSFMRDLYVAIPGYSTTRINAAYAYGGMDLLDQTLEENFGVKIDGNVEVDFEVFQVLGFRFPVQRSDRAIAPDPRLTVYVPYLHLCHGELPLLCSLAAQRLRQGDQERYPESSISNASWPTIPARFTVFFSGMPIRRSCRTSMCSLLSISSLR